MNAFRLNRLSIAVASAFGLSGVAHAQLVINDTLTGASSSYPWVALNGACLTAGDGSGSIPACVGLSYYSGKTLVGGATGKLPDAIKSGALRLSNGDTTTGSNGNNQTGAIVSSFTFPTTEGLQVTWTSVTYGGNAYKNSAGALSGADGIGFFLSDGGTTAVPVAPTVGALGGSLGYSCSNTNGTYDGVLGGYIGIGMDEFGNFSNKGDNTDTGASSGQSPGSVAIRGAGHTTWAWLNSHYAAYYPSSLSSADQLTAMHNTCKSGYLYNFGPDVSITYQDTNNKTQTTTVKNTKQFPATYTNTYKLDYNYPYLQGSAFPSGTTIYNQEALGTTGGASNAVRGKAVPVTYALTITAAGIMDLTYSVAGGSAQTVASKLNITASNGPLPASFRFGFSAGTGGGSNVHEITCFKAAPANISSSTAGSNVQSGRVESTSQLYLAYYHPINSWGSVTAQNLNFTAASGSTASSLVVSPTVKWDAGCVLTGGLCQATNTTVAAPLDNTTRSILSWNGTQGIPFEWSNLVGTQQSALGSSDRLDFLRGKRGLEVAAGAGGTFRNRTSLLGDIVDSSPVWVGPPSSPYSNAWADLLNTAATPPEASTYGAFAAAQGGRTNVVYVGSNDGMLHGFRAGSYSGGAFSQTNNDGQEVLSYVPSQAVSTIHSATDKLDFSNPSYSHNFFVDASPGQGDLYYNGGWHTWIVSGLGPGGQAAGPITDNTVAVGSVFALDVTDPSTFAEKAAGALAMGEWTSSSLTALGCTGATIACGDHLGETYGTPLIRRLHDGSWAVIFGNGLNSKSGTSGLYIVHIDSTNGNTKSVQYIDTGAGATSKGAQNGIGQVTAADLDGDHITDYVYAGDVLGNVWRFDLTDKTATNWTVSKLFTTQAGQPITSGIAVDVIATTDQSGSASTLPKVIIAFGTGQKLPQSLGAGPAYPTVMQSIYGIWDANMSNWNSKATIQLASLSTVPTIVPGATGGNLLQHTLGTASDGSRTSDVATSVCWYGSTTACTGTTGTQMGWEVDLSVKTGTPPASNIAEQVLFNPLIAGDVFNTNTVLPVVAQALTCDASSETAYSIGISMTTGGATPVPYFANYPVGTVGVGTQATGTSSVVTTSDGRSWLVYQKDDGTGGTTPLNITGTPGSGTGQRLTWTKLR